MCFYPCVFRLSRLAAARLGSLLSVPPARRRKEAAYPEFLFPSMHETCANPRVTLMRRAGSQLARVSGSDRQPLRREAGSRRPQLPCWDKQQDSDNCRYNSFAEYYLYDSSYSHYPYY